MSGLDSFGGLFEAMWNEDDEQTRLLSKELGISSACASDVVYLRTRHRHTPELEKQLIELHQAGTPPNIFEFGVTPATQKALIDTVNAAMSSMSIRTNDEEQTKKN